MTLRINRIAPRHPEAGRSCGFTLIELTLVAVVMAILLVASLPRFQHTSRRLRTEGAAFELMQLLRYARERAVADGHETIWVWNADDHRAQLYRLVMESGATTVTLMDDRVARAAPLSPDISVTLEENTSQAAACPSDLPSGTSCVSFLPDGTGDPAVLHVRADDSAYLITVNGTTGQAQLSASQPS